MTPLALDIAVGFIIFLSTLVAYYRGIVREFFVLFGFIVAVFVSFTGGNVLVPTMNKWFGVVEGAEEGAQKILGVLTPDMAAKVGAYGSIFLLTFILMMVLRMLLTRLIHESGLTLVDKLLGAGFGFARGFLLILAVYAAAFYLVDKKNFPEWAAKSFSVPVFDSSLAWAQKHVDSKVVEDSGDSIAIKLPKIDLDKIGKAPDGDIKDEEKKEEPRIEAAPAPFVAPEVQPMEAAPATSPAPVIQQPAMTPPSPPAQPVPPVQQEAPAQAPDQSGSAAPDAGQTVTTTDDGITTTTTTP